MSELPFVVASVITLKAVSDFILLIRLFLKVCRLRCVRSIIQSCSVYVSIYVHTVMNATILQLVAVYIRHCMFFTNTEVCTW